jgi:hypothetical protein
MWLLLQTRGSRGLSGAGLWMLGATWYNGTFITLLAAVAALLANELTDLII